MEVDGDGGGWGWRWMGIEVDGDGGGWLECRDDWKVNCSDLHRKVHMDECRALVG